MHLGTLPHPMVSGRTVSLLSSFNQLESLGSRLRNKTKYKKVYWEVTPVKGKGKGKESGLGLGCHQTTVQT